MSDGNFVVSLSSLDEERFGIKTAKVSNLKLEDIPEILNYCKANQVVFLIARCSTTDIQTVQEMERNGCLLMDTLIYSSCNLVTRKFSDDASEFLVRIFRPGEEHTIRAVAAEAFKGYVGHYHADPRLDKIKCNEVYQDWAYKSCISKKVADEVIVAEAGGEIIGFGTMRVNSHKEGEGLLFGVAPSFQRKGVFRLIMMHCMKWCVEKGLERMLISTQITNMTSRKVWVRLGFEPSYAYYTFHKWFS